jgi:hypothetical protein
MEKPSWLPEMYPVSIWSEKTYDLLYEIFKKDFLLSDVKYRDFKVYFRPDKDKEKEILFWHLTSKKEKINNEIVRIPDLRRCERLPWVKPLIQRPPNNDDILDWDYEHYNKRIKTCILLRYWDFIVILEKTKEGRRLLITAYYIDNEHEKRKIMNTYENRIGIGTK